MLRYLHGSIHPPNTGIYLCIYHSFPYRITPCARMIKCNAKPGVYSDAVYGVLSALLPVPNPKPSLCSLIMSSKRVGVSFYEIPHSYLDCPHGKSSGNTHESIAKLLGHGSRIGCFGWITEGRCDNIGGGCDLSRVGIRFYNGADLSCYCSSIYKSRSVFTNKR